MDLLLTNAPEEMTRKAIMSILASKGIKCAVGSFYNVISKLTKQNLVISRRSSVAFYRYNRGKNEILRMGERDPSVVSENGFVCSVLELAKANGFEEICRIHDIHLKTRFWNVDAFTERVSRCPEVWYGESCWKWKLNKKAKSWIIKLFVGYDYRVTFQVLECGTLSVVTKCIKKAFPDRLEGLRAFEAVLREACLIVFGRQRFWPFPKPDEWIVTFWHYGKDSKQVFDCRFNVLFKDWFNGLARIYVREEDGRLRVEDFQNPRKTLGVLKSQAEKLQEEELAIQRDRKQIDQNKRGLLDREEEEIRRIFSSPLVASMVASMVSSKVNQLKHELIDLNMKDEDGKKA